MACCLARIRKKLSLRDTGAITHSIHPSAEMTREEQQHNGRQRKSGRKKPKEKKRIEEERGRDNFSSLSLKRRTVLAS